MKEKLINWVQVQKETLDKIITAAANDFYEAHKNKQWFEYDVKQSAGKEEGLWLLAKGKDLCYDRPTIGFTYSLWYHAKRVNTFMKFFIDQIWEAKNDEIIEILDLGAGTGAIQWAVALVYEGLTELGIVAPKIRMINIDTSPFMLAYNEKYLWKHFIQIYKKCANSEGFIIEYSLNSWSNTNSMNSINIWLCASYLFDHEENKNEIKKDFENLVNKFKPAKVLMLTSNQLTKREFLDTVANHIFSIGYEEYRGNENTQLFSGQLNTTHNFRRSINAQFQVDLEGIPKWDIDSLYGKVLLKSQNTLNLVFEDVKLYVTSEKDRTKIELSPEQLKASEYTNVPTLIIGPAGCGKSVVLTRRIKNLVEKENYSKDLKILLTTFNKGLIRYLGDWLEQILDKEKCKREKGQNIYGYSQEYSYFRFNGSKTYNIYILHFDILPTKVGSINWLAIKPHGFIGTIEQFHLEKMKTIVEEYKIQNKLNEKDYKSILDPNFLLDEYHRVIYGLGCLSASKYQILERKGRGNNPALRYNSKKRKVVWEIIIAYIKHLKSNNLESFVMRRYKFLQKVKTPKFFDKFSQFTNIFVDELQDCTRADYEIFYSLIENPNHIVFAGDIAQSINLGAAYHIPKADDQKNFKKIYLNGSFRLPFRISECIKPISQKIKEKMGDDVAIINPYKGSPPGARPIVVIGKNLKETASKIKDIFDCYSIYGFEDVTIFEKDELLKTELIALEMKASTETTLRMKGLEKPCVIWSVRTDVDTEKEVEEFVYTILTRTSSILIIVLSENIKEKYIPIMQLFDKGRLIFWDFVSKNKFFEICKSETLLEEDDNDNSEDIEIPEVENIEELINM